MRVGELFAGIGGLGLGLERAGHEVVFQCEIDPFCRRVLARHWPGVERAGDVRTLGVPSVSGGRGEESWDREGPGSVAPRQRAHVEPGDIDLLTGGFPCQDVSIAGKRAGLAGARTGLFWEFLRVAEQLRPRWLLLENVPGLLTSNGGRDFAAVLGGLAECGYGWAYRVLDSQHFGVAQRRRRVFIVGHRGGDVPPAILFEPARRRGDLAAGREARPDLARCVATGTNGARYDGDTETFVTHTLTAPDTHAAPRDGKRQDGSRTDRIPIVTQSVTGALNMTKERGGWRAGPDEAMAGQLIANPLMNSKGGSTGVNRDTTLVMDEPAADLLVAESMVRRLTPTECERLQGFPDGWTCLCGVEPYTTATCRCPDSARYRALGNAVTVSVAEWIGRRFPR